MKITRIDAYIVKIPHHDRFGGQISRPATFPGSDYYFEKEWKDVYCAKTQGLLVKVETDEGIYGWGEGQSPIAPEIAKTCIDTLLAPMLVGQDPGPITLLHKRMYVSMHSRGHWTSFLMDAISGIDIALWDIKGKMTGQSIASLLGGPLQPQLPMYVSGLRASTPEARGDLAEQYFAEGFPAVKIFLGRGVEQDIEEARRVRERVGPQRRLFFDAFCIYTLPEAQRLGRALQELGYEWLEAPMAPEDVEGHARLAQSLDIAIACGEPLRNRFQFLDWFKAAALDIAQPDVMRCGITEGRRIAEMASSFHLPVAFHVGICLGIGMAATWQLAAATPNLMIVEHEPPLLDLSQKFLTEPLQIANGEAIVSDRPGLGTDVDLKALESWLVN